MRQVFCLACPKVQQKQWNVSRFSTLSNILDFQEYEHHHEKGYLPAFLKNYTPLLVAKYLAKQLLTKPYLIVFRYFRFFVNLWEIRFQFRSRKGYVPKYAGRTWTYECIYLVKFIVHRCVSLTKVNKGKQR